MGERIRTAILETPSSIIDQHPETNIRPPLEDWIIANPQRARRKAKKHLPSELAQIFILGSRGLANSEISQQLRISPEIVSKKIHDSFIQLIQSEKLDPELKKGVFIRVQLRTLINKAKAGSISSTLRLIDYWRGFLDYNARKLSPEKRPEYVFEVIKEVSKNIVQVSWQNFDTLDSFLRQIFDYTRLHQDRKNYHKKVDGKAPRVPFLNDFLHRWLDEHPEDEKRLLRLLGLKRPWARDVFIATRMRLRPQQIKELFPEKTINNIRVSLNHARNFFERESGITLPTGWQRKSAFTQFGISEDQISSAVKKGEIGAVLFRGVTHLCESDFQRYLEQKRNKEASV